MCDGVLTKLSLKIVFNFDPKKQELHGKAGRALSDAKHLSSTAHGDLWPLIN